VDLCIHFPIRLHCIVLRYLSTGTILPYVSFYTICEPVSQAYGPLRRTTGMALFFSSVNSLTILCECCGSVVHCANPSPSFHEKPVPQRTDGRKSSDCSEGLEDIQSACSSLVNRYKQDNQLGLDFVTAVTMNTLFFGGL
jgi:hypothetical protein